MKLFRVSLLTAWILAAALAGFAPAQNVAVEPEVAAEQDVAEKVNHIVSQMRNEELGVWDASLRLERLGPDASPAIQQQLDLLDAQHRIAAARALCKLGRIDIGVKALARTIEENMDKSVAVEAAELLRDYTLAEGELVRLLRLAKPVRLRVALARSLFSAATTEEGWRLANTTLGELFRTATGEDRKECALALASINDYRDEVLEALEELQAEPGHRGGQARALLDFRRLREAGRHNITNQSGFRDPLLRELARNLQTFHVEPPRDYENLRDAAAKGMAGALDPFTRYFDAKEYREFREGMSGEYAGIGARVGFLGDNESEERQFCVIRPIYSGPAYRAGIRSYDVITKINGEPTDGKELQSLVDTLRGKPGTEVEVSVQRYGVADEIVLSIKREEIHLQTVYSLMLPGGVGYVRLMQFGDSTMGELANALDELEGKGMRALIVDLRNNPGGLLSGAVEMSDMFLKNDKLIVRVVGRDERLVPEERHMTSDPATRPDYPLVMLVNGSSASASEIVAGALQDYNRAVLVGERTYGKGSVQRLMEMAADGRQSALKLTIAQYFLPSGRSIHRTHTERGGVKPDIEIRPESKIDPEDSAKFEAIRRAGSFNSYTQQYFQTHRKQLERLADFDGGSYAGYPGFEEWYESLTVPISRDAARSLLRTWIRIQLADEHGAELMVDIQDDDQLARSVAEAMTKLGDAAQMEQIDEYRDFHRRFKVDTAR